MSSYEHERLGRILASISEPPNNAVEYEEWLQARRHLDLMRKNPSEDELIVCAISRPVFIQTAVIGEHRLLDIDKDDLLSWSDLLRASAWYNNTEQGEFSIERDSGFMDPKTLEDVQRLVFLRNFDGSYLEILQEYLHLTDSHWIPEQRAYCRYNELGDLDPIVSITAEKGTGPLASFKQEPLELYLAASNSVMVRLFDFILSPKGHFRGWSNQYVKTFSQEDDFFYRQNIEPGYASYTRGVQIIRPRRTRAEIFAALERDWYGDNEQWVEFLARDLFSGRVMKISTDPATTTHRGDPQSSLACDLSSAFFRPEVLLKYKADPDKYTVRTRRIACRSIWGLSYDVNEAGQVHAYIYDLRRIPYQEQQYWASFNETPRGNISKRSFEQDFLAQWSTLDPIDEIVALCRRWASSDLTFWKLGDEALLDRVSTPNTESRDEWAEAFLDLWKLVVEGFVVKAIRTTLDGQGIDYGKGDKSIALLSKLLANRAAVDPPKGVPGLSRVNQIRTKGKAHFSGGEGRRIADEALEKHGTYAAHFNHVCEIVLEELKRVEECFASLTAKDANG